MSLTFYGRWVGAVRNGLSPPRETKCPRRVGRRLRRPPIAPILPVMTTHQWYIFAPFAALASYIFVQLMLRVLATQRYKAVSVHDRVRAAKEMRIAYLSNMKSMMADFDVDAVDNDEAAQEGIEITDEQQLADPEKQKKNHTGKQARLAQMSKARKQGKQPAEPEAGAADAIQQQIDSDPSINVDLVPEPAGV